MIKVPYQALSRDTLIGIVDEFVTREGTDYGHRDHDLESKRASVLRQLENGEAEITFDPRSQSANIVLVRDA